jgi:hypothetical protein
VRLLLTTTLLAMFGCDPQLAMSGGPTTRTTVEGCSNAVQKLKTCCPAYDSYVSCTLAVSESALWPPSPDITKDQSECLMGKSCEQIEKAVTAKKSLCDVTFRSQHCH